MLRILFYISIFSLFLSKQVFAEPIASKDSHNAEEPKHEPTLQIGIDLVQPIVSIVNPDKFGFQLVGAYRFNNDWYLAGETGYANVYTEVEPYMAYTSKGGYFKLGFNYNVIKSSRQSNNTFYFGSRFVASFYQQYVNNYNIGQGGYWLGGVNGSFDAGKASTYALEALMGANVEIAKNIMMGWSVRAAFPLGSTKVPGFGNLYIPGLGYNDMPIYNLNYTITYLIPMKKHK